MFCFNQNVSTNIYKPNAKPHITQSHIAWSGAEKRGLVVWQQSLLLIYSMYFSRDGRPVVISCILFLVVTHLLNK